MKSIADQHFIQKHNYTLSLVNDRFNKRIRVDDLNGDIADGIRGAEQIAIENKAEKLIFKGRKEDFLTFIQNGYMCEAVIDRYFLGSDMYFFCKYYRNERRTSNYWIQEDDLNEQTQTMKKNGSTNVLPSDYFLKKLTTDDSLALASLYGSVFKVYPTPLNDPEYIAKTMAEGTIYYGFIYQEKIVSAASAEVNSTYKNAELTDCATLIEHRQHGLLKMLLNKLECELREQGIYCAYSIARALSFGMNAALKQLSYNYRGRLTNNCYIFDKLEDMNVWVKNLTH